MHTRNLMDQAFHSGVALCVLVIGSVSNLLSAEDQTETLRIKVGDPTRLSDRVYQDTASLMVSRTGVVAAF